MDLCCLPVWLVPGRLFPLKCIFSFFIWGNISIHFMIIFYHVIWQQNKTSTTAAAAAATTTSSTITTKTNTLYFVKSFVVCQTLWLPSNALKSVSSVWPGNYLVGFSFRKWLGNFATFESAVESASLQVMQHTGASANALYKLMRWPSIDGICWTV